MMVAGRRQVMQGSDMRQGAVTCMSLLAQQRVTGHEGRGPAQQQAGEEARLKLSQAMVGSQVPQAVESEGLE